MVQEWCTKYLNVLAAMVRKVIYEDEMEKMDKGMFM